MNNFKDLRKAAFAVGFGFTLGKAVGGYVEALLNGAMLGVTKAVTKHRNETVQEALKKSGVKYESEDKNKMDDSKGEA